MSPLHRRAENALTELARVDCLLVQGYPPATVAARLRAARDELEAILREAGVIPSTQVDPHWLEQKPATQEAGGVISLADARARRSMGEWR